MLQYLLSIFYFLYISSAYAESEKHVQLLIENAREQIGKTIKYDGSYQKISYPGGDIEADRGVCTDVIIRTYRTIGFDLQKLIHKDMKSNFNLYPSKRLWGLNQTDTNIDHRRVPNMMTFFQRHGQSLSTDLSSSGLEPGDLLTWNLPGKLPHIGLVSDQKTADNSRYLIIHNIGKGTQEEDIIEQFELTGHYRYRPWLSF